MSHEVGTQEDQARGFWSFADGFFGIACAVILVAMALLTAADVVARYGFDSPIRGAFELTEILLACLVFLSMPVATREGVHIEVELVNVARRPMLRRVFAILSVASGLAVFGILAYQLWRHAAKLDAYGQVTNSLEIPLAYVGYLAAACCLITCVAFLPRILMRER